MAPFSTVADKRMTQHAVRAALYLRISLDREASQEFRNGGHIEGSED
jgi:hypothetical protein